jgi:NodT family efflux transporter outer membrane factor (OMF) lipoprotein
MPTNFNLPGSRRLCAWLLPAALAGCTVGPDFERPALPDAGHYTAQPAPATTAGTAGAVNGGEVQALHAGAAVPQQWWHAFGSPKLNALVDESFAASPSVVAARAALTQAEEVLHAQRGYQLPSADLGVGARRQKTFVNFEESRVIGPLNLYNADVSVSYGIDLFGGLRRRVEAQRAAVEFQRYELQATYQTLAGNVVTASVQEASLRARIEATEQIIDAQQKLLDVAQTRYDLGAISYAQLLAARSELATVRATLPQLQRSLAAAQAQLAVYLGKLPAQSASSNFSLDELKLPVDVPLGVPSELVRRRPDVLAAEALLHRASAEVGVATADLFPKLTLGASAGASSNEWSSLFDNRVFTVGANLAQPLFHGGSLRAQKRAAEAAYDIALADYRLTVLNAFRNTADAVQAVVADADSLRAQHEAMLSAEQTLQLVEQQYQLGSASYLALLTAQRQTRQARIDYLQRLASRYQNTAALMLAVGGEWTDPAALAAQQNTSGE